MHSGSPCSNILQVGQKSFLLSLSEHHALSIMACIPPTLAFDASRRSLLLKPSSLPMPRVRPRCTPIWMDENRNREGAVAMTILMLPAAPTAAKNIWQVKQQGCLKLTLHNSAGCDTWSGSWPVKHQHCPRTTLHISAVVLQVVMPGQACSW